MKLTVGLLALLAFGYLCTVLAGPLTGEEITEAGMEVMEPVEPEVQVTNRRRCKCEPSDVCCREVGCRNSWQCPRGFRL